MIISKKLEVSDSYASKPMNWEDAKAYTDSLGEGWGLPTDEDGKIIYELRNQIPFLNLSGSFPAGYVWLAEPDTNFSYLAWCQRISDGVQYDYYRDYELPVLSVRR